MHRLIVLACLWRQAAPALQYHVAIDGSHATIAYDAGNATAAARAFVAEFDIQTHGTCEDAACVEELVEAELDAFASRAPVAISKRPARMPPVPPSTPRTYRGEDIAAEDERERA